jgi:hypothetical protein
MASDWLIGTSAVLLAFAIFTVLLASESGKKTGQGTVASIPTSALTILGFAFLIVPGIAAYGWLAAGDPLAESVTLIFAPVGVLVNSVVATVKFRSSEKTIRQALNEDIRTFLVLAALLYSVGGLFLGLGAILLSSYGHYFSMTFSESGGGDAGLAQRGSALLWVSLILEAVTFAVMTLQERKQSGATLEIRRWLLSWQTLALAALFGVGYGLTYLGDLGDYLILVGCLLVFVPWEFLGVGRLRGRITANTDLKGLTTVQLIILWCGAIVVLGLCVLWALVANSVGPLIPGVVMLTIAAVVATRPSSAADKAVVLGAVFAFVGALVLLPVGFFVYERLVDSNSTLILPREVQLSEVHWSRCVYPGVIELTVTAKNLSESSKLKSFDLKLSVKDEGRSPEVFSDSVSVALDPGEARVVTHFFGRPTQGRDVHNFLMLRPMFSDKAELSYDITGTKAQ